MPNFHDSTFKDLIANRDFKISFLKQYLPKAISKKINFETIELLSGNVEHVRPQNKKNKKTKEQSDLVFLVKFDDANNGLIFIHIEHQTTNDATILLRTIHYQTSILLDYFKSNKDKKLDRKSVV